MNAWDIIKLILVLLIVIGIMLGILFLMRKYLYSWEKNKPGKLIINVLATQMLMPKRFVSIVKIYDKLFILGISDQSITLLDKIENFKDDINLEDFSKPQNPFSSFLPKNWRMK